MSERSGGASTVTGGRRDPDRFRDRVLGRAVTRANEKRVKQGLAALPKITPHSLRRTWAMLDAQAGGSPITGDSGPQVPAEAVAGDEQN